MSPEEQKARLARAASTQKQLRDNKRAAEKQALVTRRRILQDQRQKKAELEEKRTQKKISIMDQLKPLQRCATSSQDLPKGWAQNAGSASRAQYHKVILGRNLHLLEVTRKLPQLIANLRELLGIAENDGDSEVGDLDPEVSEEELEVSEDDSDPEVEEEESDEEQAMEVPDFNSSFSSTRPGMLVAVGYENDVYVGEVENILTNATAVVNFMSQCKQKKCIFK